MVQSVWSHTAHVWLTKITAADLSLQIHSKPETMALQSHTIEGKNQASHLQPETAHIINR